jgi:hypothetical protein
MNYYDDSAKKALKKSQGSRSMHSCHNTLTSSLHHHLLYIFASGIIVLLIDAHGESVKLEN